MRRSKKEINGRRIRGDMTPRLIGETYMKYPTEKSPRRSRHGVYECQYCGTEYESQVYAGGTKSCGCLVGIRHGLRNNKFYTVWKDMLRRCTDPKNKGYKNYGGRGITVCKEWLDVRNFVAWCESTHPNTAEVSLDRINNEKGYSPNNCRWADRSLQNTNQRMKKNNTSGYTGVTWHKNIKRWCSTLKSQGVLINIGTFKDKMEAVQARDNYIIENNLQHKLSTDYK